MVAVALNKANDELRPSLVKVCVLHTNYRTLGEGTQPSDWILWSTDGVGIPP
eukprot:m.431317 g.431317  ORF g.431317 m.431317 type:complete len:52 (+) comp17283_c0_seq1:2983-3138(+)